MKSIKYFFIAVLIIPLFAFTSMHKFYLSVTEVEYVEDKESVQIITRIFIDDFEKLIHERYDESVTLAGKDESKKVEMYMERYLKEKIEVKIDNESVVSNFLGKEYEEDIVYCYLEIENVKSINTFQITNEVLFDMFDDQQNIVKLKMNNQYKSYLLKPSERKAMLKFN